MKLELKDFDSVNLHDSKLLNVEERFEFVRLEIDEAIIYLPVKGYDCTPWIIRGCSLECSGVTGSEKKEWADTQPKQWLDSNLATPVTNPALPIYEISSNEVVDSFLIIGGFTRLKNWVSWRITAKIFELNWKTLEEFK